MASVLRVIRGPLEGSVYVLGDRTRIGRAVDAHIQLTEAGVSRHHARIVRRNDGSFHLADLSSKAGTLVNGESIRKHALSAAERITIGATEFVFEERVGAAVDSSPRFHDKVRGFPVLRATECFMPMTNRSVPHPGKAGPEPAVATASPAPHAAPRSDTEDAVPYAPGYAQPEPAEPVAAAEARKPRRRSTKKNLRAVEDAPKAKLVVREAWGLPASQAGIGPSSADAPRVVRFEVKSGGGPAEPLADAPEPADAPDSKDAGGRPELSPRPPAPEPAAPVVPQAVLVRDPDPPPPEPVCADVADAPEPAVEEDVPRRRSPHQASGSQPREDVSSGPHIGVGADPEARERGLTILREVLEYRDLRLRDLRGEALSSSKRARYDALQLRLMNTVDQADLPGSRRYQRFSCSLPACILQRDGDFSRTLDVELEDLSAGGARITASDPAIRVGDEVWLAFNLAALFSYGQKVVFRCRVVWTRPLHAKLGLMFGGTARFAATLEDATKDP